MCRVSAHNRLFFRSNILLCEVILTRFSRVTINAAHKYLGLTTEVIRTEKAINEIACHPLPSRFYEGGGLQALRHRFDRQSGEDSPDADIDYFSFGHSQSSTENISQMTDEPVITDSPIGQPQSLSGSSRDFFSTARTHSSRYLVQAGDLHTSAGLNDPHRTFHRSFSAIGSGMRTGNSMLHNPIIGAEHHLENDDFDLREEVMSCIAKSIGLHQPPLSGSESVEASPAFSAVGSRSGDGRERDLGFTSFGSLSLLDTGDDASSMTGDSALGSSHGMGVLDNEVEILYFAAGSTLARAGERHPGMFIYI